MDNLGFISPNTFEKKVTINERQQIVLFQEDIQKELLEKKKRREGPLFEGDETFYAKGMLGKNNPYLSKLVKNPQI